SSTSAIPLIPAPPIPIKWIRRMRRISGTSYRLMVLSTRYLHTNICDCCCGVRQGKGARFFSHVHTFFWFIDVSRQERGKFFRRKLTLYYRNTSADTAKDGCVMGLVIINR